jgi:DNA-binding CsgD family transcriptional regulator
MDGTSSALRRALARARDGKTLDRSEATTLLQARGAQLDDLLTYAARTRDAGLEAAGRPGVITYSRKVFIPLTHLCRDRCGYCTFATVPHKLDAPYLSPDEVLEIARQGAAMGCKEALFTLGDRPEDRWPAAREWLEERGYSSTLAYVRASALVVGGTARTTSSPEEKLMVASLLGRSSVILRPASGPSWSRTMSLEQAIEYALDRSTTLETAAPETYPAGLSAREVEVLGLVAQGMTNAEVAKRLFISPRTVGWHLGSIYRKLEFSSRTEATRFAVEQGFL